MVDVLDHNSQSVLSAQACLDVVTVLRLGSRTTAVHSNFKPAKEYATAWQHLLVQVVSCEVTELAL